MTETNIEFSEEDFSMFRRWLCLNMDGITWQGKFEAEFEEFWNNFFIGGMSLTEVMERFQFAESEARIGPLISWFTWLRSKFINFVFVFKNPSLYELANLTAIPLPKIAHIIREFLLELFPHLDDEISPLFQLGNVASDNLNLTFKTLSASYEIPRISEGSHEDEIMPSLEVTLYEEWNIFLKKLKTHVIGTKGKFKNLKSRKSLKRQFSFLKEVILLVVIGGALIIGVKRANEWYEFYLTEKIGVYEPQFKWGNKKIKFKGSDESSLKNFKLDLEDIEQAPLRKSVSEFQEDERFETESDVVLTSWDSLPKDFDIASLQQSEYEEMNKVGNRDTRFGNRKVYRVMMKSVDTAHSKKKLNKLLDKYRVSQADNVKPGMLVPGGVYYNVFVPREFLKEFLAQVMEVDDAVLYETRTRRKNPPGKNRVLVWIKSL